MITVLPFDYSLGASLRNYACDYKYCDCSNKKIIIVKHTLLLIFPENILPALNTFIPLFLPLSEEDFVSVFLGCAESMQVPSSTKAGW